ncbi:Protein of unknown function [Gryllus bimaculatus]|nr:Protein of unknown function [Gryllus bimaculatus]
MLPTPRCHPREICRPEHERARCGPRKCTGVASSLCVPPRVELRTSFSTHSLTLGITQVTLGPSTRPGVEPAAAVGEPNQAGGERHPFMTHRGTRGRRSSGKVSPTSGKRKLPCSGLRCWSSVPHAEATSREWRWCVLCVASPPAVADSAPLGDQGHH